MYSKKFKSNARYLMQRLLEQKSVDVFIFSVQCRYAEYRWALYSPRNSNNNKYVFGCLLVLSGACWIRCLPSIGIFLSPQERERERVS